MTGIANIALLSEETGRIFGLDAQLLFDILIQGLAVFLLFIFLTYVLINPVRKVLEDRQNKIKDDLSHAATDRAEAEKLRAEYDEKIKNANSEAGEILSSARKRAVKNEETGVWYAPAGMLESSIWRWNEIAEYPTAALWFREPEPE